MNLLYDLPIYKNKIAYGNKNFPWSKNIYKGKINYGKQNCPQAEKLNKSNYLNFGLTQEILMIKKYILLAKLFRKFGII